MTQNFKLIINTSSGHNEKEKALSVIREKLPRLEIITIEKNDNFLEKAKAAILAAKTDGSIVVAAGGDGSINAVAGLCLQHDVPMGVLPMGTFNFFARDIKIPVDLSEALDVLLTGKLAHVPVGMLNDQIFLVHAGIGLYSEIMRNREKDKRKFGRYRIVAFISSFLSLMKTKKTHSVTIETETEEIKRQTLNIFVGNNVLQLEKLGLVANNEVNHDELAVILLKPMTTLQRLRFTFLGLIRNMKLEKRIETFTTQKCLVETKQKNLQAAIDGELVSVSSPLHFKCIPSGLRVMIPEQPQS